MEQSLSSEALDHLGLVSSMCEELDLVKQIDLHFPKDVVRREISIGTICKTLILNRLGFTERRVALHSTVYYYDLLKG